MPVRNLLSMTRRASLVVALVALVVGWRVMAQEPPRLANATSPFRLEGLSLAQPHGADERGDVFDQSSRQPLEGAGNTAADLRYVQLVATAADGATLTTAAGETVNLLPDSLAFALALGGDAAAGFDGQSVAYEMLLDTNEGGGEIANHPGFTANYILAVTLEGDQAAATLLVWDPIGSGFVAAPQAAAVSGGLLRVAEGASDAADGVWAATPWSALVASRDDIGVVLHSRVARAEGNAAFDDWPDFGQMRYKQGEGWRAEAANLLAGQAARVSCTLLAPGNVNVRSAPATSAALVRQIPVGQSMMAVAQTTGRDGFVWWRLRDGNWVRSDVVRAEDKCQDLPRIQP